MQNINVPQAATISSDVIRALTQLKKEVTISSFLNTLNIGNRPTFKN